MSESDAGADGIFGMLVENTVTPLDDARGAIGLPKAAEGEVSSVARYDFRAEPPPNVPVAAGAGSGGGDMDDVLRRLGVLESDVSVIKTEVAGIAAQLPHFATRAVVEGIAAHLPNLATKEDLMAVKAEVAGIAAQIPHLATRAEIGDLKGSMIQWMVGTAIAIVALIFTMMKFVH